jgi:hypothetical protein
MVQTVVITGGWRGDRTRGGPAAEDTRLVPLRTSASTSQNEQATNVPRTSNLEPRTSKEREPGEVRIATGNSMIDSDGKGKAAAAGAGEGGKRQARSD